jgi:endonuclease YncB( thermonuclease family)
LKHGYFFLLEASLTSFLSFFKTLKIRKMLTSLAKILTITSFILLSTSIYFTNSSTSNPKQIKGIFNVLSGDTISFNGLVYQLEGIKAPSSRQKCKKGSLPWFCGAAAKRFLAQTIGGIIITCKIQRAGIVKCSIHDRDLAIIIAKAGWAVPTSKQRSLKAAELYARKHGLGLWSGEK